MIEYIIITGSLFIGFIYGGYSKYKSYEYRIIKDKDDEIDQWIHENKRESIGKRSSNYITSKFKSSKE